MTRSQSRRPSDNEIEEWMASGDFFGHFYRLFDSPVCPYSADVWERVQRAIDVARRSLRRLPRRVHVRFVDCPDIDARGAARLNNGRARIVINLARLRGASSTALEGTVYHECQHLADWDDPSCRAMCPVTLERRAIEFALEMAQRGCR